MPGEPGATVATTSCATYTLHTRLRVQRAPGIPHALCWAKNSRSTSGASRRGIAEAYLNWGDVNDALLLRQFCLQRIKRFQRLARRHLVGMQRGYSLDQLFRL